VLKRRENFSEEGCDLVFHEADKPIHPPPVPPAWTAAREAAKIPTLIPHDMRRSAVRQLERARVPRQVAMRLVHRTESIYRRYAIVSESDIREAGASLDALPTPGASATKSLQLTRTGKSAKRRTRKIA
jgi:hypothetical protein